MIIIENNSTEMQVCEADGDGSVTISVNDDWTGVSIYIPKGKVKELHDFLGAQLTIGSVVNCGD